MKTITQSLLIAAIVALSSFVPSTALLESSFVDEAPTPDTFVPALDSDDAYETSVVVQPDYMTIATPSARPALPLNLTVPYSAAPATWSIRLLDGTYYWLNNNTLSEVTVLPQRWHAATVESSLKQQMGSEKMWKRQQKTLEHHVRRVNRQYATGAAECISTANSTTCTAHEAGRDHHEHEKHGKHHKKGNQMMDFFLQHAQCRACVQPNAELLHSTTRAVPVSTLPYLASYQPAAILKWCTSTQPKLKAEKSPLLSSEPLADWEGVCVPAEVECPSSTTDMNILSPTTCAADEPATKQSCTLCVLDGYHWQTSTRAFDRADNYAGQCIDSAASQVVTSWDRRFAVQVTELDGCPSVVASLATQRQFNIMFTTFAVTAAALGLLLCCSCLRACCRVRKARQIARIRLANAQGHSGDLHSFAVAVPAVSSSPTPSAPPAAGYPAAVAAAAAQQYHEPLLSSGLNPPRMSVSSLYP